MLSLEQYKKELESCYEYLEILDRDYKAWVPCTIEEKICMPFAETLDELIEELIKINEEAGNSQVYVEMSEDVEYLYYRREETDEDRDEFYQRERDITNEEIKYLKILIKGLEDER